MNLAKADLTRLFAWWLMLSFALLTIYTHSRSQEQKP